MPRCKNRFIVILATGHNSKFGLITEKLSVRNFILTGPGTMHLL